MKKFLLSLFSLLYISFTVWYLHFADPTTNDGALSAIGRQHPVWFAIWGLYTFAVLFLLLAPLYRSIRRLPVCYGLLLPAGVGMALTVGCPFDGERHTLWLLHCIGSLTFSVCSGAAVFLCFCLRFSQGRYWQSASVLWAVLMFSDFVLLLIFKETGLIEAVPILVGVVLLNIAIYLRKKEGAYAA